VTLDVLFISPRDKLLLRRFADGKSDKQIATDLGSTEDGIAAQRRRIAIKFGIQTSEQLREVANRLASWPCKQNVGFVGVPFDFDPQQSM